MRVTPNTNGVKFIPGRRYMINTATGVVFPYHPEMIKNPGMVEIFPKFETKTAVPDIAPVATSVELSEPVEIDEIVVELPPEPTPEPEPEPIVESTPEPEPEPVGEVVIEPLKPWQKAQAAKKSKAAKEG